MRKVTIIWLIVAASLVGLGIVVMGVSVFAIGGNFNMLNTAKFETNTYTVTEEFQHVSMKIDTTDVLLLLSDDGSTRVECYEKANKKHSVSVQDGVLVVEHHKSDWFQLFDFGRAKITIYLPKTEYESLAVSGSTGDVELKNGILWRTIDVNVSTGDVRCFASAAESVRLKASTGNIRAEGISTGTLSLSVSTGKVTVVGANCAGDLTVGVSTGEVNLSGVTCQNVISTGDTGDISLQGVIALGRISVERSTGDVHLEGCDAAEIFVTTDTGDVSGRLLSEKVFIVRTDTGKINVPKTVDGGRCEITTDTGNVHITVG